MRGNFNHGSPMGLKARLRSLKDQEARLKKRTAAARAGRHCATCDRLLVGSPFIVAGQRYCSALCIPRVVA